MDLIHCPRCNSAQKFGVQTRVLDEDIDLVELFVSCKKCRWETIIDRGTRHDLRLQRDLARLRARVLATNSESLKRTYDKRRQKFD